MTNMLNHKDAETRRGTKNKNEKLFAACVLFYALCSKRVSTLGTHKGANDHEGMSVSRHR